jgi:hypothetical protein
VADTQTHLVVSHNDGDVDELSTAHGSDMGRKLIVCCVDMGCVAIVVGVPGERRWCLGRIVDACFRGEYRILGERTRGGEEGKSNAVQKHDGHCQWSQHNHTAAIAAKATHMAHKYCITVLLSFDSTTRTAIKNASLISVGLLHL